MKTLKVDYSADPFWPGLVLGAAFFCGLIYVTSSHLPKRRKVVVFGVTLRLIDCRWCSTGPTESQPLAEKSSPSWLSRYDLLCTELGNSPGGFMNVRLWLDLWAHWARHACSLFSNQSLGRGSFSSPECKSLRAPPWSPTSWSPIAGREQDGPEFWGPLLQYNVWEALFHAAGMLPALFPPAQVWNEQKWCGGWSEFRLRTRNLNSVLSFSKSHMISFSHL